MSAETPRFRVCAGYEPTGDQPAAIAALAAGFANGDRFQTLEGVTGSGKTFTMAHVIAHCAKPTLIISHNKTLAAQLYAEFKSFFPDHAVEYFVSYFDYYQPEAYIPQTDTFIEKDSAINEEIERLRLSATNSLMNRRDVVIIASVSCIYGLGSPDDYKGMIIEVTQGTACDRDQLLLDLVGIQYNRNDIENAPGTFRVRGDCVDIFPSYARTGLRLEFFGDTIDSIHRIDSLTGRREAAMERAVISPAKHFVTPAYKIESAIASITAELEERVAWFEQNNKLLEAQRIRMRTMYDLDMMRELGYCSGIENYSRHLTGRAPGDRPYTMLDYFEGDFLTIIDESHVTLPQIRGMYNGDQARKSVLVEHGFRLPSALDNRPLRQDEFLHVTGQTLYVSATPGPEERRVSTPAIRQVIRPTGIVDPPVEIRPLTGQIDDVIEEIRIRAERGERTLVTTLTKKTAEDLTEYLMGFNMRVRYLHSEIDAIQRVEILRGLRKADFDCLVGINLLREGLDLPEVSLVAILDADKEGFLRSETSLIQTAGRAARHIDGRVILYADHTTDSMRRMIDITAQRRAIQLAYNTQHGITPTQIVKSIQDSLAVIKKVETMDETMVAREGRGDYDVHAVVQEIEKEMLEAAAALEFERAAMLRDQLKELQAAHGIQSGQGSAKPGPVHYSIKRKPRAERDQGKGKRAS